MDDEHRWAALFRDLEAGAEGEDALDRAAELADRVVAERGRLRLIDRLQPVLENASHEIVIATRGQQPLRGRLTGLGSDWLTLARSGESEWLVALGAVTWLRGVAAESAEPGWEGAVGARSTLTLALRRLMREGVPVTVATVDSGRIHGTITTVGKDHVELIQPADGPTLVASAAIAFVSRR